MKYAKLVFKNILRNKLRTLLTLSSLVVSLFLIVTLGTIVTEFDRNAEESNPLRLMTRHAVSLGFVMPMAHVERIRSVPGVKNAMPFNWFGGIYKDEKNFFANFAVDATRMREIMTELKMPDEQWQAFINDKQGAVVGQKLVTLYGFTPGQRITLKSPIYNQSVEFIIRGVCTGGDEKTLFFHHDYINELMPDWAKDQVSMVSIMANSADDVPRIAQAVDSIFANSDAPTKTETEKEFALSFQTMMGGVKTFMYAIMAAITFSVLLVMGNTMAMTVRERTKEVGTLKAIGFQRRTIAFLFLGEALIVACVGAAIGIGGAQLIYHSVPVGTYIPFFSQFIPTGQTLLAAFTLSVLVGLISVAYSAYRVSGLTIAEALRSTE
ncbi:MAG TPA: FtsX-like permease family protein [Pyrinomonadaceae bacterium]|jgi:ABC-type transport system, involved in lipoprotein release, permease component|nr:FtsX-like permease family protein [Pyrinomonadaceae bacterium]